MKITAHDHGYYLTLFFLLLPELNFLVAAQPGSTRNDNLQYTRLSPTVVIIIAVIVTAVFCFVMSTAYIRHRNGSSSTSTVLSAINRHIAAAMTRGLDDLVLETFPTFKYSEVKSHKKVDGALECAVCLNEFEDDETLRLIPKCDHVFHNECIDAWLEFHVTCPVCRANLVPQPGDEPVRVPHLVNDMVERCNSRNDEIMIDVNDGNRHQENPALMNRNLSSHYPNGSRSKIFGLNKIRSYSTGHASVQSWKNLERFTLRLPAEIRKEAMKRALLNPSTSCVARLPREGSSRRGDIIGNGEGSSRAGWFNRTRGNFVTWPFSMSGRLSQVVVNTKEELGSSKGSTSKGVRDRILVKMPSL